MLVDTGPLVAILHKGDQAHECCASVLKEIHDPLLTTWSVITEAMYLLAFSPVAQDALLDLLQRELLLVAALTKLDMPGIRRAMAKYRDLPMDFADATLVVVAERDGIDHIFTLDRRDFGTYRLHGRTPFILIP